MNSMENPNREPNRDRLQMLKVEVSLRRARDEANRGLLREALDRLTTETAGLLEKSRHAESKGQRDKAHFLTGQIILKLAKGHLRCNELEAARRGAVRAMELLHRAGELEGKERLKAQLDALMGEISRQATVQNEKPPAHTFSELLDELERDLDETRQIASHSEAAHRASLMRSRIDELERLQRESHPGIQFDLAADMRRELDRHLAKLQEADRRRVHEADLRRLRSLWPRRVTDFANPEAYRMAAVCKSTAPAAERPSWENLRRSFDRHNARHYFNRALEQARNVKSPNRQAVNEHLERAVGLDPSLAPHAAMLTGLMCIPPTDVQAQRLNELREELLHYSQRIINFTDVGTDVPQRVRDELLEDAVEGFRRICLLLIARQGDGETVHDRSRFLWQMTKHLAKIFRPVLDRGTVQDIDGAIRISHQWRDACDAWFDPRHPYHRLERDLLVARRLREAEDLLMKASETNGFSQAKSDAKKLVTQAIDELGIRSARLLGRAIKLYAISKPLNGSEEIQAVTLGRLMKLVRPQLAKKQDENDLAFQIRLSSLKVQKIDRWIDKLETQVTSAVSNVS